MSLGITQTDLNLAQLVCDYIKWVLDERDLPAADEHVVHLVVEPFYHGPNQLKLRLLKEIVMLPHKCTSDQCLNFDNLLFIGTRIRLHLFLIASSESLRLKLA